MPPDPPSVQALLQVALFCEVLLTWMNLLAFDEAVGVGTGGFTRVVPLASSCSNLLFSSSFLSQPPTVWITAGASFQGDVQQQAQQQFQTTSQIQNSGTIRPFLLLTPCFDSLDNQICLLLVM